MVRQRFPVTKYIRQLREMQADMDYWESRYGQLQYLPRDARHLEALERREVSVAEVKAKLSDACALLRDLPRVN